jgi:hypothetical protein
MRPGLVDWRECWKKEQEAGGSRRSGETNIETEKPSCSTVGRWEWKRVWDISVLVEGRVRQESRS